jgi:carboxylesterase
VSVRPGAEPYSFDSGDVGVLLCHGFTGNPTSLRPWAEAIAAAGHTVRLPRLPGHGTTWKDMSATRWADWYGELDAAFRALRPRVRVLVVAGLSMGGALALRLAEQHGCGDTGVDGLVLVNPAVRLEDRRLVALPAVRWIAPWLPPIGTDIKKPGVIEDAYDRIPPHALHSMLAGYRAVVADLPAVTQPVLLFRSAQDHVVPASSSALILERISSADAREVVLTNSYHVATLDNDAPQIFEGTVAFMNRLATAATGGGR